MKQFGFYCHLDKLKMSRLQLTCIWDKENGSQDSRAPCSRKDLSGKLKREIFKEKKFIFGN